MTKPLMIVLLLCGALFAQIDNVVNAYDTSRIIGFNSTLTKYGKAYPLSRYENVMYVAMFGDTGSAAGFSNDSCAFLTGYRLGTVIKNKIGRVDTSWSVRVVFDSCKMGSVTRRNNTDTTVYWDASDGENAIDGYIDTLNVTGYAVYRRNITTSWDGLIQPFVIGIAGNKKASYLDMVLAIVRRAGIRTN
jgi:hypothetical protein